MNLQQIREECWDLARDIAPVDQDRLWPTREMNRYINRVYKRIASETRCIRDNATTSVCLITVAPVDYTTYEAGTLDYIWANDPGSWLYQADVCPYLLDLHDSIIQIDEAKWAKRQWKLVKVSARKWQTNPWWERVKGMPTEYATDLTVGKIALNFRDETEDTLHLQVRRMPLEELKDDKDVPEFRINYHEFFINGVLMHMYSKQDSEAFDGAKMLKFKEAFLQDIDEIKQQETQLEEYLRPNYSLSAFR